MRRVIPLLLLLSCSSTKESPASGPDAGVLPELPKQKSPRLDEVFTLATHNSYWVDRGAKNDSFASGTSERLLDQLLYDHVRSIEIDIHKDGFKVYHTVPGNSVCDDLHSCLGQVRAFHTALPGHDPLLIVLELKELFEPNFDETHTPENLDTVLGNEIGEFLFKPYHLMNLCPDSTTLGDCTRRVRWPSFVDLRGRMIVALIGNWDELGSAQSTKDWAVYAAKAPSRAAFPMASPWKLDASTFTPRMQEIVTQQELDIGWQQSAFVQIEDLADPHGAEALARGAIIRADGANTVDDQEQRIKKGFQFLQTDTPAIRTRDRGFAFPYGPMTPSEPGVRFLMGPTTELAFAYRESDKADELWTTWVTSGNDARRIGCLRAAASLTDEKLASMTVCRVKTAGEHVVARIEVCRSGTCTTKDATEAEGAGEQIGLQFTTASCVAPRVAAVALTSTDTDWHLLDKVCFDQPLHYRGIARPSGDGDAGPVLFTDTKVDGARIQSTTLKGPVIDATVP